MSADILDDILGAWEDTYKKGQLSLWIFLSLKDGTKYVDEIKDFVEKESEYTITCEEQSLYRSLRKYQHVGVVDFEMGKGDKGPDRKYYFLTPIGKKLLQKFISRNINLFFKERINNLLN